MSARDGEDGEGGEDAKDGQDGKDGKDGIPDRSFATQGVRRGLPCGGVGEGERQFATGGPFCWPEWDEAADAAWGWQARGGGGRAGGDEDWWENGRKVEKNVRVWKKMENYCYLCVCV